MQFHQKIFKAVFFLLIVISVTGISCRSSDVSKEQVKELEKVDNQEQEAYQKEYEDAIKKHNQMQSDRTKEMTKQRKKQQINYNKAQKRSLWDRIFRKKCNTDYGNG